MSAALVALAPAKLNLALSVGPPEPGGRHPISSWMVTVDLFDTITLTRLPEDRFSRYAVLWHADARRRRAIDWPITRDLAVRAHLALEARVGARLPVQMKLEKRIPVGGGLGGGSSDAAAMLVATNELFDLDLSRDELAAIGATLGSDVPFLVHGGSAHVAGMGERIERQDDTPRLDAVLVLPDVACPTGAVYGAFDARGGAALRADVVRALIARTRDGRIAPDGLFNDLTVAATDVAPELAAHLERSAEIAERPVALSGSGSTVFIVCDDPLHAAALATTVERRSGLPALPVQAAPGIRTESPTP